MDIKLQLWGSMPQMRIPLGEKEEFDNKVDETLSKIGDQQEWILIEDMNARIERRSHSKIVSSHGEEVRNDKDLQRYIWQMQYEDS